MNPRDLEGAQFRKGTGSGDVGCVEVAMVTSSGGTIGIRDSKQDGRGPVLAFTPHEWKVFVAGVRNGEFDYPG